MENLVDKLYHEERLHREASAAMGNRRAVADLLLAAADEISRLQKKLKAVRQLTADVD